MPMEGPGPPPIDENAQFDSVILAFDEGQIINVWVHRGDDRYRSGKLIRRSDWRGDRFYPIPNDPELAELRRRVANGTPVYYLHKNDYRSIFEKRLTREEMAEVNWDVVLHNPLDDHEPHLFFYNVAHDGRYDPRHGDAPGRLTLSDDIEGASDLPILYARSDGEMERPAVHSSGKADALAKLATAGWTPAIPAGPEKLRSLRGSLNAGRLVLEAPQRSYLRGDVEERIHRVALAFNDWFLTLDSGRQGLTPNRIAIEYFKSCIGRLWELKPFTRDIGVFPQGTGTTRRTVDKLEAEDWLLGDLELWVGRGIQAFPLAINQGNNATLLDTQFDDFTFCHMNADGTLGERLYNGSDGLVQADWDRYQAASYEAALTKGAGRMTVTGASVNVQQGETATARVTPNNGVPPYRYSLPLAVAWAELADDGELTLSPTTAIAAQEHSIVVKVQDRIGADINASVTVTVTAPPADDGNGD